LFQWISAFLVEQGPEFFLSIGAIFLAIWNGRQTSRHSKLSVIPAFSVWADYPEVGNAHCTISIGNKGFGPAIIDETLIFYGSEKMEGVHFENIRAAVKRAFGESLVDVYQVASGEKGHAMGAGENLDLAEFQVTSELVHSGTEVFSEMLAPIVFSMKYHDIYRRRWVFLVHEFVGYTIRCNSVSYFFWYRFKFRKYLK